MTIYVWTLEHERIKMIKTTFNNQIIKKDWHFDKILD